MGFVHRNYMRGTLSSSIDNTQLTAESAAFANLPEMVSGDHTYITLDPEGTAGDPERLWVWLHAAGSTEVSMYGRGYPSIDPGSSVRSHSAGTVWTMGIDAAEMDSITTDVAGAVTAAQAAATTSNETFTGTTTMAKAILSSGYVDPVVDAELTSKAYVDAQLSAGADIVPMDTSGVSISKEAGMEFTIRNMSLLQTGAYYQFKMNGWVSTAHSSNTIFYINALPLGYSSDQGYPELANVFFINPASSAKFAYTPLAYDETVLNNRFRIELGSVVGTTNTTDPTMYTIDHEHNPGTGPVDLTATTEIPLIGGIDGVGSNFWLTFSYLRANA